MEDGILHQLHILIADPNEDSANLTATLCHNIGVLEVNFAHDFREVVAKLEHHHFDLLIVSHRFPPKGGVHLAHLIHGSPKSPDKTIPIIILAGTVNRDEIMEAKKLKNCLFLLRPLSTQNFYEHVLKLAKMNKGRDEKD